MAYLFVTQEKKVGGMQSKKSKRHVRDVPQVKLIERMVLVRENL